MQNLTQLEAYYDAVPRSTATTEVMGPLTLFVGIPGGWPYYARPTLGGSTPITAADVTRVRARQRELGIPESFEWIHEVTPTLRAAAEQAGLHVHAHPLLVLGDPTPATVPPTGYTLRRIKADDPALAQIRAVQNVAFGAPGTAVGAAGPPERDLIAVESAIGPLRDRLSTGETILYAADGPDGPVAAGMHQLVNGVTEIVGIATLPSARRRGLGAAITRALITDALAAGAHTIFLSAGDQDVARMYESVGFTPVATALIAEPPLLTSTPPDTKVS